jgi:hypothetical protein
MTAAVGAPPAPVAIEPDGAAASAESPFVWAGVAGLVVLFVGLFIARMLPPPSPGESAGQIAAFYQRHTQGIRAGTILMGFGAALMAPWFGVITRYLRRIPGHGPATAYCQLALDALLVFEIVLPITLIQVVAFRPERIAGDTLLLDDLAMILLVSPAYTVIVEWMVTGIAILRDRGDVPVFPRWSGWVSIGTALLSIPGVLVIFHKTGPWRWSGAIGFWVPAVVFGLWMIAMSAAMLTPRPS